MINKSDWMKILPISPDKLSFAELKNFKEFDELLKGEDLKGPTGWQEYMKNFRWLQFFAIASIEENKYPVLTKCWNDLNHKFMNDPIFDDGVFIESWIYFNLPLDDLGETLLDKYEIFLKESGQLETFNSFLKEMKKSRLGLYEETMSSEKVTKFKELFTGNVISTVRSVPDYGKGEIFLTRIVEFNGDFFQFGDPKCWPQNYKNQLEDMILNKLFYFDGKSINNKYENFMKLAGPYWFSCVTTDSNIEIHEPDHYLVYLESEI